MNEDVLFNWLTPILNQAKIKENIEKAIKVVPEHVYNNITSFKTLLHSESLSAKLVNELQFELM